MGYYVPEARFEQILAAIQNDYTIYAPKQAMRPGQTGENSAVRYGEISSAAEIIWDKQSDFSPKEVIYPIVQTLLYFKGDICQEHALSNAAKPLLVFLRACDLHGIQRLDTIFLQNGGQADCFYQRLRERLHVVVMECGAGFDECFCVSMGTNAAAEYSAAARNTGAGLLLDIPGEALKAYFKEERTADYRPVFVTANRKTVTLPDIDDRALLSSITELDYWKKFDTQCISCGGCNTVCISCSCFDTVDVTYNETSLDGERRRVWSSCMLENFTVMAGGHGVRHTPGARMRFKALHKIYDFQKRFGGRHMCVGCGRCDKHCPADIRFSETINALAREVSRLKAGTE